MNDGTLRFDLLDEPWIPVRGHDGRSYEVSIREVLANSRDIREIGGELPPRPSQSPACCSRSSTEPSAMRSPVIAGPSGGEATCRRRTSPTTSTSSTTASTSFTPERPFFQVAGLQTKSDEVKDVSPPLILDLPSNNRLFTNRAARAPSDCRTPKPHAGSSTRRPSTRRASSPAPWVTRE